MPVGHRHADQLDDDPQRKLGRDRGHEVTLARLRYLVDEITGDDAHVLLEPADHAARETEAHELAVLRVPRRILVDEHPLLRLVVLFVPRAEDGAATR